MFILTSLQINNKLLMLNFQVRLHEKKVKEWKEHILSTIRVNNQYSKCQKWHVYAWIMHDSCWDCQIFLISRNNCFLSTSKCKRNIIVVVAIFIFNSINYDIDVNVDQMCDRVYTKQSIVKTFMLCTQWFHIDNFFITTTFSRRTFERRLINNAYVFVLLITCNFQFQSTKR